MNVLTGKYQMKCSGGDSCLLPRSLGATGVGRRVMADLFVSDTYYE